MLASSMASAATVTSTPVNLNGNAFDNPFDDSEYLYFDLYNASPAVVSFTVGSGETNPINFGVTITAPIGGIDINSVSLVWQQDGSSLAFDGAIDYSDPAPSGTFSGVVTTEEGGSVEALVSFSAPMTANGSAFDISPTVGNFDLSEPFTLTVQANPNTAPVPLPAAAWLFASGVGLVGLLTGSRRKQRGGV
jgi:hypothetical protein